MLKTPMPKKKKEWKSRSSILRSVKRNIYIQAAGLILFIILITATLVFALTTAWYTNTISVGGLTFQAEAWGFNGDVIVDEGAPINALPGDSGIVNIRVTNESDVVSSIGVSISKQAMGSSEMQRRIYFYADKTATVNGEQVDKVYLSSNKGYSYVLYGRNELILTDDVQTDVLIKWEWVYDVLGYYFVGSIDENSNKVSVDEYLRPVEYDLDDAKFDPESGKLTHIGEKDVNTFLAELTESDGYEGKYRVSGDGLADENGLPVNVKGTPECYPIDEENNIWLYLCTESEIDSHTAWDTAYALESANTKPSYQARITLTGQQMKQETITLDATADVTALIEALNTGSGDVITLSGNMECEEPIVIDAGVSAVLDLNGYTITNETSNVVFSTDSGATLTVIDGTVKAKDGASAFKSIGSHVTLDNVTVSNAKIGFAIFDNESENDNGDNSVVRIVKCDINATESAVRINGDGTLSEGNTQLIVQNSKLNGDYAGILGNGNTTNPGTWGTVVQVISSEVTGYYAGIYNPQMKGTVTVSGKSTITGITGIAMKGGDLTVIDSTVKGIGEDNQIVIPEEPSVSGWIDTGDGILVETNYGYPISITISGESEISCTDARAYALRQFPEADNVKWNITGGKFSTAVPEEYLNEGYRCEISEGGFTVIAVE